MSEYNIKIEDNVIYISEGSPYFRHGFKMDLNSLGCHDCLNLADKFKRCYYQKLKENTNSEQL